MEVIPGIPPPMLKNIAKESPEEIAIFPEKLMPSA